MSAIERAAEALKARYADDKRKRVGDARATFRSIDVGELARVITDAGGRSPDYIACVIYDYLTGDESDE